MSSSDMIRNITGLLLLLSLQLGLAESYKAAVVAYKPERLDDNLPNEILERNKHIYVKIIEDLQFKADIIIFPENGLTTLEPNEYNKDHLEPYSIVIPDPETNYSYNNLTEYIILHGITNAAKSFGVYVVFNVLEKVDGNKVKYYSTDVVFNSDGKLIAKCRKKFLFSEVSYSAGDLKQKCIFEAKFSKEKSAVKFLLLFDTDILSSMPEEKEYDDIILTSSIKNKLPISYGLSLHVGYSARNKVNLLVSEYTNIDKGYWGTGIYFKNGTSVVAIKANSVLVYDIPHEEKKIQKTSVKLEVRNNTESFPEVSYENISTLEIQATTTSHQISNTESQCKFNTSISGSNNINPYKWVALNIKTNYLGKQERNLIICALMKPKDVTEQKKINALTISALLNKNNVQQLLPLSLKRNMLPANFEYEENIDNTAMTTTVSLTEQEDLIIFGIVIILKDDVSHGSSIHFLGMYSILLIILSLVLKIFN